MSTIFFWTGAWTTIPSLLDRSLKASISFLVLLATKLVFSHQYRLFLDNPTIVDNDMKLKFLSLLGEWNQTIPKEFLLQLKNKLVPEVNEKIHNELQHVHFIDTIW